MTTDQKTSNCGSAHTPPVSELLTIIALDVDVSNMGSSATDNASGIFAL